MCVVWIHRLGSMMCEPKLKRVSAPLFVCRRLNVIPSISAWLGLSALDALMSLLFLPWWVLWVVSWSFGTPKFLKASFLKYNVSVWLFHLSLFIALKNQQWFQYMGLARANIEMILSAGYITSLSLLMNTGCSSVILTLFALWTTETNLEVI